MSKKYVLVETISTFKSQYMIPIDDIDFNEEFGHSDSNSMIAAKDIVTCEEANEIGQQYLGETIVDTKILDEKQALNSFDIVNDYARDWSIEKKLKNINNWRVKE